MTKITENYASKLKTNQSLSKTQWSTNISWAKALMSKTYA